MNQACLLSAGRSGALRRRRGGGGAAQTGAVSHWHVFQPHVLQRPLTRRLAGAAGASGAACSVRVWCCSRRLDGKASPQT